MGIERARGEIRYRFRHQSFVQRFDLAKDTNFDDGRLRVSVHPSAKRLCVRVKACDAVEIDACVLYFEQSLRSGDRFFLNGYQSWTDSREFSPDERIGSFPPLLRPALERFFRTNHYGDYDIVPSAGRHLHGFTYMYTRACGANSIRFYGSLSEAEGFTIFRVLPEDRRIVVQKDCTGLALTSGMEWKAFDLYVDDGDEDTVFEKYFHDVHESAGLSARSTPPWTGWTSWYYHYTNINETIILSNLDAFREKNIPIDVFQIDDGWQTAVGDWLEVKDAFPQGLRPIVDRIHEAGYRAGLWLAPFVAEKKSQLAKQHPEWLLRDAEGNPIPAGHSWLWSGDFYGLDIDQPGLRSYLANVFDTVLNVWGFDLVKLDFLYGACLVPAHGKTRGTRMVEAMDLLRKFVGDKLILGCGVPLGPAIGRVDICRIGPDVGHEWTNTLTRGLAMRETVSTVTALENAIGRRHWSGRAFSNDPDVFFLRSLSFEGQKFDPFIAVQELRWGKRIPLDESEKYTLFLLNNILGRLVFTSDDVREYSDNTQALYLSAFPLREKSDLRVRLVGPPPAFGEIGGCYEMTFRIDSFRYRVYANLSNETIDMTSPVAGFSRDEKLQSRFFEQGSVLTLEPHASICLLEESSAAMAVVASEGHLFPGSDLICSWNGDDDVSISRDERARGAGNAVLKVRPGKRGLRVNGRLVPTTSYLGRDQVIVVTWE